MGFLQSCSRSSRSSDRGPLRHTRSDIHQRSEHIESQPLAAFGNSRYTGRVCWDHRTCFDQLCVEPSSGHFMGQSFRAHNPDTGDMSRAIFLLRRDPSFFFKYRPEK